MKYTHLIWIYIVISEAKKITFVMDCLNISQKGGFILKTTNLQKLLTDFLKKEDSISRCIFLFKYSRLLNPLDILCVAARMGQ